MWYQSNYSVPYFINHCKWNIDSLQEQLKNVVLKIFCRFKKIGNNNESNTNQDIYINMVNKEWDINIILLPFQSSLPHYFSICLLLHVSCMLNNRNYKWNRITVGSWWIMVCKPACVILSWYWSGASTCTSWSADFSALPASTMKCTCEYW